MTLRDGRTVRVECKNSSPKRYSNGDIKIEVQKTRATQGDPAGRLYKPEQFDVVAACLFAPTGQWRFAYRSTAAMDRDQQYPERLVSVWRNPVRPGGSETSGLCRRLTSHDQERPRCVGPAG